MQFVGIIKICDNKRQERGIQEMAELKHTKLVDDLAYMQGEHVEATERVEFGLDGQRYKIDLTEQNAKRLRAALDEFIQAAQNLPKKTSRSTTLAERADNQKIRSWARTQHIKVSDRGRIPIEVLRAYAAGHELSHEQELQLLNQ